MFPISRRGIQPHLKKALEERGWEIANVESVDDNLWWIELWTLESRWAPPGFRVYLAFEFDDVTESIGAATQKPVDHHDTEWLARLDLSVNWDAELPQFLDEINRFRDLGKTHE